MTTQADVIKAFCRFENSPRRASNFRMVTLGEGGHTAFLVGGRDGKETVIAKREPLNQITVYARTIGLYRRSSLSNRGLQNQVRRTKRIARRLDDRVDAGITVDRDTKALPVDEVDQLEI